MPAMGLPKGQGSAGMASSSAHCLDQHQPADCPFVAAWPRSGGPHAQDHGAENHGVNMSSGPVSKATPRNHLFQLSPHAADLLVWSGHRGTTRRLCPRGVVLNGGRPYPLLCCVVLSILHIRVAAPLHALNLPTEACMGLMAGLNFDVGGVVVGSTVVNCLYAVENAVN